MFGGYRLLRYLTRNGRLTPTQITFFRAGHAHAGVLLLMSLLYYTFLNQTLFSDTIKLAACVILFGGILAQTGGFFIHMVVGEPNKPSIGTSVTMLGAVLLASATLILVYGLLITP